MESRKPPESLTDDEANQVYGAVMDSRLQDEIMAEYAAGNCARAWLLDYVFDSNLFKRLETVLGAREERALLDAQCAEPTGLPGGAASL